MTLHSQTFDAPTVKLGAFRLDQKVVDKLHGFTPLAPEPVGGTLPRGYLRDGDTLYRGASAETPAIGDVRVGFEAVAAPPITVLAGQFGDPPGPDVRPNDHVIQLVELGAA